MFGFKPEEEKAILPLLASLRDELRGLRVAVELLALKQQAVPIPEAPDDSAFLSQDDGDFALLEHLARQQPSDEVDLLEEQARVDAGPPADPSRPPIGSFRPRFSR